MRGLEPGKAAPTLINLPRWTEVQEYPPVDYHLHTAYTDGTASPREMAEAAVVNGMAAIVFSEHVRHTSTYFPAFVEEIRDLQIPNLKTWVGVESKILNTHGVLDCSSQTAEMCDVIIGSVHSPPANTPWRKWTDMNAAQAIDLEFELAMAIVSSSRAHILGHPMGMTIMKHRLQPLEQIRELARACRQHDKAFELNARYCPDRKAWLGAVREAECKVSFGSDAHRALDVGNAWRMFVIESEPTQ